MSVDLTGKVALVTGAARGMGAAEARLLTELGAKVVLTDVLEAEGEATATSLGAAARFVRHDVTDEKDWATAVAAAVDGFGGSTCSSTTRPSTAPHPSSRRTRPDWRRSSGST